jgi:hypothetical protein
VKEPQGFLAHFDAIDRALVKLGFPATSPWFRGEIGRLFDTRAPNAVKRRLLRRWIIRAGRRAGKSSTLARLAVAWALFGDWLVPPGDIGVVAFVSLSKDEASSRLRNIEAYLSALGVAYERRGDELEIGGARPVLFKVFAANTSAVVGFTAIAVFGDEISRFESRDSMANPARAVFSSLAPTMATQPSAFMVLSSSPWSLDDYHAELFDLGETDFQMVSFAPTWVANPTITEADTHGLESDLKVWSREYAAIPSSTLSAALTDTDALLYAFAGRLPTGAKSGQGWIAIDPNSQAGEGGDGFGLCAGWTTDEGEIVVSAAGEFPPTMHVKAIVPRVADLAKSLNVKTIFSDQREQGALSALFAEHNLTLIPYAWSESSKMEAIAILSRWFSEHRLLVLPNAEHEQAAQLTPKRESGRDQLRRELLAIKAKMMPSGRIQYTTSGADIASCLITLAHAQNARDFVAGDPPNALFAAFERMRKNGESLADTGISNGLAESLAARRSMAERGGWGGGRW